MKNHIKKRMSELNQLPLVSVAAETNGLYGQAFIISAITYDKDGNEMSRFVGRCPIKEEVDTWVAENVLPKMDEIAETHKDYESMLSDFISYILAQSHTILCCSGHLAEAELFRQAFKMGMIDGHSVPYDWIDAFSFLPEESEIYGEYEIECSFHPRTPIYACIATYKAFKHFVG